MTTFIIIIYVISDILSVISLQPTRRSILLCVSCKHTKQLGIYGTVLL